MFKYDYIIKDSHINPANVLIISLVPRSGGDVFYFKPGQYAMLSFRDKNGRLFINHPFSISSPPSQRKYIQFGIKIMGNFTQNLSRLTPGDSIVVMGPYGNFIFEENKHQDAVFIAGGIGITPFLSSMQYMSDRNLPNKATLFYSNRTIAETSFYEDIKRLNDRNPNFKAVISVTKEVINDNIDHLEKGYITKETFLKHLEYINEKVFFICGPIEFMKAMDNSLQSLGIPKKRIRQEAFSMSPKLPFRENYKNTFIAVGLTALIFVFFLNFIIPQKKQSSQQGTTAADDKLLDAVNSVAVYRRNKIITDKQILLDLISSATPPKTAINSVPATAKTTVKKPAAKVTAPAIKQTATNNPAPKSNTAPAQVTTPAPKPTPDPMPAPTPTPTPAPRTTVS